MTALLALAGCTTQRVDPLYEEMVARQANRTPTEDLGSGDLVQLTVLNEEGLSGDFTVSPSGTISYPYVGRISVLGKTCIELEDAIVAGLQEGYLKDPSVTCAIKEYNSKRIYLFGEVKNPGAFPYKSNSTVIEAIAMAGGFGPRARENQTRLSRNIDGVDVQVEIPVQDIIEGNRPNLTVLPGDVIYVPVSPF